MFRSPRNGRDVRCVAMITTEIDRVARALPLDPLVDLIRRAGRPDPV